MRTVSELIKATSLEMGECVESEVKEALLTTAIAFKVSPFKLQCKGGAGASRAGRESVSVAKLLTIKEVSQMDRRVSE